MKNVTFFIFMLMFTAFTSASAQNKEITADENGILRIEVKYTQAQIDSMSVHGLDYQPLYAVIEVSGKQSQLYKDRHGSIYAVYYCKKRGWYKYYFDKKEYPSLYRRFN